MKIKITGPGREKDEIYFTSPCGEGRGIWCGTANAPGVELEVEFELTALLMRWIDILPSDSREYRIGIERDRVVFTGRLDNIEEDGTCFLQMGEDNIMFECLGEPMALGSFVELRTSEVRIYPVVLSQA